MIRLSDIHRKISIILFIQFLLLTLYGCGGIKISYVNDIKAPNPAWEPLGMTIDREGNIYITDRVLCVVHKFNNKFIYKGSIGELGKPVGKLMVPLSVAVDDYGKIWVSDFGNASISCYNEKGSLIWSRGGNLYKEGDLEPVETIEVFPITIPEGITSFDNAIFASDSEANFIFKIKADGSYEKLIMNNALLYPEDVCYTPEGLLIADTGNTQIILPDGSSKEIKTKDGSVIIPHRVDVINDRALVLGTYKNKKGLDKTVSVLILMDKNYKTISEKILDPEETGDAIFLDSQRIAVSYPKISRVVVYSISK